MEPRKAKLVSELMPAAVPVAQYLLNSHMDQKRAELQAEKEIAVAEAQAEMQNSLTTQPQQQTQQPQKQTSSDPAASEFRIDELLAEETCSICREVLQSLRDEPPGRREKGLAEYGRMKEIAKNDPDRLSSYIDGTEVLNDQLSGSVV